MCLSLPNLAYAPVKFKMSDLVPFPAVITPEESPQGRNAIVSTENRESNCLAVEGNVTLLIVLMFILIAIGVITGSIILFYVLTFVLDKVLNGLLN